MTGTRNSDKLTAAGCALALLAGVLPLPLTADELVLEGAEHLSGVVRAISENGAVVLETPLSPEPISLKGESVKKVIFSGPASKSGTATCGVTLANEDVIPGDIESVDDKHVTMISSIVGRLVIPRELVYSLQLGGHQPDVIYAGPDGFNGWTREQASAEHWTFDDGVFHVKGNGRISRDFEVPQQFIVRFKLSWESSPNLRFYFASAPGSAERARDRYYLQFNSEGMELKREASSGRRYTSITTLKRLPQQYVAKHLTIEIRVDRSKAKPMLQLYLNDEPEDPVQDPVSQPPAAGGISFESIEDGPELQISNIEVMDWSLKGDSRRSEERGDMSKDALLGIKSERFSGTFLEAKKSPDGMLYVFKSSFQDDPIEVPESEVATIFFAGKKSAAAEVGKNPFVLRLRGGGSLHVSSCSFSAEQVEATHPLLGRLTCQREGVAAFERVSAKSKDSKAP